MATRQLKSRDYLWSDAPLRRQKTQNGSASFHKPDIIQQKMHVSLFLGCLQATPSISEAALVDPDMAVAPSLDLWQMGLTATGVRKVHIITHGDV